MAKRSVKAVEGLKPETDQEPVEAISDEQLAEWENDQAQEHEARLAPYRAMHEQQNEQDDLLAELLFKETLREMEE